MIDADLQARDIEKLNATFERYAAVNKRNLDDLLVRKGRDLGIKLYQGYRAKREGRGYAARELRARTRSGLGTRVRDRVLREKWLSKIPRYFPPRGKSRRSLRRTGYARPLTRQQLLVGQEVIRREVGRGALAASFLWFRRARRWSKSQDRYVPLRATELVKNRVARVLGQADITPTTFRIRGYGPGLAVIDARYSIVRGAIARSDADMQAYIDRKVAEATRENFPPRLN